MELFRGSSCHLQPSAITIRQQPYRPPGTPSNNFRFLFRLGPFLQKNSLQRSRAFFREAFKFGRHVHFAFLIKMLNPPIAQFPTI